MNRNEFTKSIFALGMCPFLAGSMNSTNELPKVISAANAGTEEPTFIENWLSDLLSSMEATVDRETQVKIIEGCGRGCYNRHQFKQDIAANGKGDVNQLIEAYKANFEIWKAGDGIHIRYGETSAQCYCPVVKNLPPKPDDLHCECTKATHQSIFEAALHQKVQVNILESLRRGGKTCHFLVTV